MQQQEVFPAVDAEHGLAPNASPLRVQRVKRLDSPNKAAHFEQIGSLQAQIDSLQQRIMEIKSILDNRAQNRHIASPELAAARKNLADLNSKFKEVIVMKRAHRDELELVKEKLRGRSGFPEVTVEELDEQIRKLEYRQTHTTLPIEDERRLIVQIERLKKSQDSLRRHDSRSEQDLRSRSELVDLLKKDDEELNALKAEQEQQRLVLADIREKESAQALDIPALLHEKSEAYETIKGLRDDIRQLKIEFSAKEDEYWKREKEWRAQQVLERKIRAEKGRAEWLEREKLRKQRALENFVEPYTNEIIMCEQLLSYMQKNAPVDEGASAPQQQQKVEIVAPVGFGVALVSKKNRNEDELDSWFAGSGGKKGKKGKGFNAPKSKVREKISLSLDALTSFEKLKISPPATYGDIAKNIEELKLKKEQFLELQKKARELRESGENGGSHGMDVADVAVSPQPSGEEATLVEPKAPVEEASLVECNASVEEALLAESSAHVEGVIMAECFPQVEENGSCADHNVASEDDSGRNAGDGSLPTENVDAKSNLEQDGQEEVVSIEEATDSKDNAQLDDKAHLETFEFSEAHLHTEEDAHIEEQAAENGVASVIFECAAQNGALKELSGENLNIEERVVQYVENGVSSHSREAENGAATVDETLESPLAVESITENGEREDMNGIEEICKDSTSPIVEGQVAADLKECEMSENGASAEKSLLLASGN